jgi:hypothetical protein
MPAAQLCQRHAPAVSELCTSSCSPASSLIIQVLIMQKLGWQAWCACHAAAAPCTTAMPGIILCSLCCVPQRCRHSTTDQELAAAALQPPTACATTSLESKGQGIHTAAYTITSASPTSLSSRLSSMYSFHCFTRSVSRAMARGCASGACRHGTMHVA